jgi:hypothetical protein
MKPLLYLKAVSGAVGANVFPPVTDAGRGSRYEGATEMTIAQTYDALPRGPQSHFAKA